MTDTPNPIGRPSKYDPAYCDRIVELCGQGKSLAQVAHAFGVARQTLDNWAAANPDFLEALSRAKTAEQAWWEEAGQSGLFLDKFNAAVWKKSVEARFRDDYTERKQTELSGSIGLRHEDALAELE